MKQLMINREHGLHVIAAAVLVALGSSHAAAQQPSQQGADRPQTQSEPQGVQSPSERQPQGSVSQGAGQDSASQRQGQDSASQRQAQDSASAQESDTRSAAASADSAGGSGQLDGIAEEHDDLSSFIEAVKAAGMEESLTGGTEYTVFAPTNDALEAMSGMSLEELMSPQNREQLISLLRAHIVADDVDENMARTLQQAQTIDGGTIDISASGDEIQVGDATVVESGIQEGSLRVYAIDQVLEPTALARADSPSDSESESGSQLDIGSEQDSDSSLDIGSERDSDSPQSQRDSGSSLEREDPLGSDDRPGAPQPGALPRPDAPQPGALPRPDAPQPGAERPASPLQN
jgi:uncharacterized surface protein with fasciclin (FAS1) repeats